MLKEAQTTIRGDINMLAASQSQGGPHFHHHYARHISRRLTFAPIPRTWRPLPGILESVGYAPRSLMHQDCYHVIWIATGTAEQHKMPNPVHLNEQRAHLPTCIRYNVLGAVVPNGTRTASGTWGPSRWYVVLIVKVPIVSKKEYESFWSKWMLDNIFCVYFSMLDSINEMLLSSLKYSTVLNYDF